MGKVAEQLRAARAKIAQGWCQGRLGEDENGDSSGSFCRWCSVGALMAANASGEADALLARAMGVDTTGLVAWNDAPERTQADVLAAFDRAIELAEQEGS